ncbi:histidine kinase dimerization/phospho-acceptor domain-containing protein [Thiothrix subterranea]|uniref:histidine kinase dimerization/phospho-acceptor domain-containing protein n=1 Tax=Thiothrix subterranea TaxID=2735563 RepID=UPI00280BCCE8|nr:histidine kinase dimerization/phospho-acceptor domain-containing protein [Thiothrix subterranea]
MKEVKPLHKRLQKQLKRSGLLQHGLPDDQNKWQHFLHQIDLSYTGTSDAQYLLERSLEVSSQEMRKLYDDLKTETEQRIEALHKSEQKTRFMANMSHELRTPIHGILGSLEIVKDTTLDQRQKLFVDTAYASCEVMLDVINNILDFSKLKAGGIELEIIEFSRVNWWKISAALCRRWHRRKTSKSNATSPKTFLSAFKATRLACGKC